MGALIWRQFKYSVSRFTTERVIRRPARSAQVVAALAGLGIVVNEMLVRQVKVEMLKQAAKVEREQVKGLKAERPQARRPSKVPPRRSFRS
jgi:hypothetical protein